MATALHPVSTSRLTPVQWLICVIAAIGFAFDIYEILMLPLVVRPALLELTGAVPDLPSSRWIGRLFTSPPSAGSFARRLSHGSLRPPPCPDISIRSMRSGHFVGVSTRSVCCRCAVSVWASA